MSDDEMGSFLFNSAEWFVGRPIHQNSQAELLTLTLQKIYETSNDPAEKAVDFAPVIGTTYSENFDGIRRAITDANPAIQVLALTNPQFQEFMLNPLTGLTVDAPLEDARTTLLARTNGKESS